MISSEGETVPFDTTIIPADAKGMVEKWLIQVMFIELAAFLSCWIIILNIRNSNF